MDLRAAPLQQRGVIVHTRDGQQLGERGMGFCEVDCIGPYCQIMRGEGFQELTLVSGNLKKDAKHYEDLA